MFNKQVLCLIVTPFLLPAFFFIHPASAEDSSGSMAVMAREQLRGPAFTDPGKVVAMPVEWMNRPISREGWAEKADLAVTLDQHLYPALLPLIQEYARKLKLDIAVQEGTCGISAGKLREKKADMGGFCCPPGETDRLPGLAFHTLGIGSLALLVNRANPLSDIDLETARNIFRGRVNFWKVFGAGIPDVIGDEIIHSTGRLHCKARPGHWRLLLDNEDLFGPRLNEVSTISDMISCVARKRGSLGYETLWMLRKYDGEGKVKRLRVNAYDPYDNAALIAGNYPLYRTYNITTWTQQPARNAIADDLANYIISNFNRVDTKYGIIPAKKLRDAGWKFTGNELRGELR